MKFDELNIIDSQEYIKEYFKPMPVLPKRKREREEASKEYLDVLLFLFALISVYGDKPNWYAIEKEFRVRIEFIALKYCEDTDDLQGYLDDKSKDFIAITKDFVKKGDPYGLSEERAVFEAVNEANDVVGLSEVIKAEKSGYKYKIWRTEKDDRVRPTHEVMEGKKIPINEMFVVGNGLMRYPHDYYYNPDECPNCRCALEFARE